MNYERFKLSFDAMIRAQRASEHSQTRKNRVLFNFFSCLVNGTGTNHRLEHFEINAGAAQPTTFVFIEKE